MFSLKELQTDARNLASKLLAEPPCLSFHPHLESCLAKEEKHPLTRGEIALGWVRRPFNAYNPDRLCLACRAYWHAANAATALDRLIALNDREAAQTKAKA